MTRRDPPRCSTSSRMSGALALDVFIHSFSLIFQQLKLMREECTGSPWLAIVILSIESSAFIVICLGSFHTELGGLVTTVYSFSHK